MEAVAPLAVMLALGELDQVQVIELDVPDLAAVNVWAVSSSPEVGPLIVTVPMVAFVVMFCWAVTGESDAPESVAVTDTVYVVEGSGKTIEAEEPEAVMLALGELDQAQVIDPAFPLLVTDQEVAVSSAAV